MKTAREYTKSIRLNKANVDHILQYGNVNGSLLVDMENILKIYGRQCAEQALKDAADRITLGQTVTSIQKSILLTPIKLP